MATLPPGLPTHLDHYINGTPSASADGATFEVADPVSNQPYARPSRPSAARRTWTAR